MKRKFTLKKILLTITLLFGANQLMAQTTPISNLSGLTAGTLAVYCSGGTVKLTSATTTSGTMTYQWKRYTGIAATGTVTPLTGANLEDVLTTPGYYTYVSVATNNTDCESVESEPVTVYVLPTIKAEITTPLLAYCIPDVAGKVLTAVGSNVEPAITDDFAYTYKWFKDGTEVPNQTASTYTLTAETTAGEHKYKVEIGYVIKTDCATVTSDETTITTNPVPVKPTITITP